MAGISHLANGSAQNDTAPTKPPLVDLNGTTSPTHSNEQLKKGSVANGTEVHVVGEKPTIVNELSTVPSSIAGDENASNHIPIHDVPLHTPRSTRVVVVGAGFAGLMAAHAIQDEHAEGRNRQQYEYIDLTIYERNPEVGGTWYNNRYPGVACDSPSPIYTFTWELNPEYSKFYADGAEIREYLIRTKNKYHLDRNLKPSHRVVEASWNELSAKWVLVVEQVETGVKFIDSCDILINGSGVLNNWKWPDIKGLHSFKGKLLHSANWDETFDYSNKKVALIGNGSSGIQILPQLQKKCSHVTNYMRGPTWISTGVSRNQDGKNFYWTEEDKKRYRDDPSALFELRKSLEQEFNAFYYIVQKGTETQQKARSMFTEVMKERLQHDPELVEKLIPEWSPGCRRLTPGEGYLEALTQPNCSFNTTTIAEITPRGLKTVDGKEEEYDAIVCATGFDVSFRPPWKMYGRRGLEMRDMWTNDDPKGYLTVMVPGFPNYFVFNGPGVPSHHGNVVACMEKCLEYMMMWIEKFATEDIRSFEPTEEAVSDLWEYMQEVLLHKTVWMEGCHSWYKSPKTGKATALWCGSVLHYREILETIRAEDFHVDWRSKNRFKFLGNGFTRRETTGDGDLAYYLQKPGH